MIRRGPTFQGMAAGAALRMPERASFLPGVATLFGEPLAGLTPSVVRERFAKRKEAVSAGLERMRQDVEFAVNALVDTLKAGHQIDLQSNIDLMLEFEQQEVADLNAVRKAAEATMRSAAAEKRHDLIVPLNESLADATSLSRAFCELYRDARWRLMEARALHEVDQPKGPVKGQPTDLDEYAKSIR